MPDVQPKPRCPSWAVDLLHRLTELEVQLGNLNPEGPWQVSTVADVYKRLDRDDSAFTAEAVDALFQRICKGLSDEDAAPSEIAAVVNAYIPSGRVPYCNEAEVLEALGEQDDG